MCHICARIACSHMLRTQVCVRAHNYKAYKVMIFFADLQIFYAKNRQMQDFFGFFIKNSKLHKKNEHRSARFASVLCLSSHANLLPEAEDGCLLDIIQLT